MRRGCDVKSRKGTGIFLMTYSQTTSMLYLSWAEIGTTGAPSATVPAQNNLNWKWGQMMKVRGKEETKWNQERGKRQDALEGERRKERERVIVYTYLQEIGKWEAEENLRKTRKARCTFKVPPTLQHNTHTLHKFQYLLVLVLGLCITNKVDLILKYDYVFQFHNLNGRQMFWCLRLWTWLITGYM